MAGFISILKSTTPLLRPGLVANALIVGANAIGFTYFLKHTLVVGYYKDFTQRIGVYGPDEPAEELKDMLTEIISNDLKDKASENTAIALYLNSGMETAHLGTIGTITGGFVGLPVFFEFKTEDDVKEKLSVKTVGKYIENDEDKELINCFLLSNDAKKYAIAREVLLVNSFQVYINLVLPFVVSFVVGYFYKEMVESFHLLKMPLFMRCLAYQFIILVGLSLWRYCYKHVLHYSESEVEEAVAQLGIDYVKGGIEYCTKEMERSSLSIESKNTKYSIFKTVDDFICKFIPAGISPMRRLQYLKMYEEEHNKHLEM